jgi:hypothetical protein
MVKKEVGVVDVAYSAKIWEIKRHIEFEWINCRSLQCAEVSQSLFGFSP